METFPNELTIHEISHKLFRAVCFMKSLNQVTTEKKQKKIIIKAKQSLQLVPSHLFHPVENMASSLTQTTKL
jgi:hypothetical protein